MFLVDENAGATLSYEDLIKLINEGKRGLHYLCDFVTDILTHSDVNLSSYIPSGSKVSTPIINKADLLLRFKQSKSNVILSTSGTTGKPKDIKHPISHLLRNVRESLHPAVWALAYNSKHMGGLQVILQAVSNGNTLVNVYDQKREFIFNQIVKHNITHISATPTFYRLLNCGDQRFEGVKRVTVGGELSQKSTFDLLNKLFPQAITNNIYATTETGAILFSKNEIFRLNKKTKIVKDTLHVKSDSGRWADTGDKVEREPNDSSYFRFVGRNYEIINVGGNNVNPHEVEEILRSHPHIKDAVVYGRASSVLGSLVVCDIIPVINDIKHNDVIKFLKGKGLENFKIPRFFKCVHQLNVSPNLKTIR